MILVCLLSLFLPAAEQPYILWLKNNKTMKLRQAPECNASRCLLILMNGEQTTLPSRIVDLSRSETYNKELKARIEAAAQKKAAEEAEQLAKLEKEKEKLKNKRIVLTSDDELPKYDRNRGSTSGVVTVDEEPLGAPLERTFRPSANNIYVAAESLTSYPSYHILKATVNNDVAKGVSWIELSAKILFDNKAAQEMKQRVEGPFAKGVTIPVTFKIPETDKVREIIYDLKGEEREETPVVPAATTVDGDDTDTDPDIDEEQ